LRDDIGETRNLAGQMPERVAKLDELIEQFFIDTSCLVPQPNPDYGKTTASAKPGTAKPGKSAKPDQEDRYDGWVSRFTETKNEGGTLTVSGGKKAFLGISSLKRKGPVTVRLRTRSAGGVGQLQWRTSDQETFPTKGQTVDFTLPGNDEWSETAIEMPVVGSLLHLRMYLPAEKSPVEVDWIEIQSPDQRPQRWEFN
jgi:hypothetical protein